MIDVDDGNSSDAHVGRPRSTRLSAVFGDGGATATATARLDTASLKTSCCRAASGSETFDDTGIFGGPQVLFVHMKPTHEAQNPMVYGKHRRTPFTNNTMSQTYAVPECTSTRRGTSGLRLNGFPWRLWHEQILLKWRLVNASALNLRCEPTP